MHNTEFCFLVCKQNSWDSGWTWEGQQALPSHVSLVSN